MAFSVCSIIFENQAVCYICIMQFEEGKEKFIQAWGAIGSNWGINRTMAQVHALLLIAPEPLSAQDIMDELNISRGNANMNLRALIDWGLIAKEHKSGERKEYFYAEKDIWQVAQQVILERRKRELKPVLKVLEEVKHIEKGDHSEEQIQTFISTVSDLEGVVSQADKFLDLMLKSNRKWFWERVLKMLPDKRES
ncbi:MarR family transcriptional regulator [Pontibacter sp. G13]|uniref:GbsR/MarR family transcriptional regulator n=1 Tax=Pontibacter sp. G13 TaxID=3074898 RepID=UPI00288A913D|nr:MarR family transcriptional regulator [Pontibacter sp. G13]WNJ15955.1 MarR family transcriptional regulator [Pontibacter sp. G13]